VVNKTPLSTRTNQILSGDAPSLYLKRVEQRAPAGSIPKVLASHAVNEQLLRSDQFDEFMRDRAGRLLNLIERATIKAVAGRDSTETTTAFGGPLIEAADPSI
jgi:hypothetical protein